MILIAGVAFFHTAIFGKSGFEGNVGEFLRRGALLPKCGEGEGVG